MEFTLVKTKDSDKNGKEATKVYEISMMVYSG